MVKLIADRFETKSRVIYFLDILNRNTKLETLEEISNSLGSMVYLVEFNLNIKYFIEGILLLEVHG